MKFNKLTLNKAGDVVVASVEAVAGFAGSNIGVKAVDSMVNNKKASMLIVAVLGTLGVVALPNKHLKAVSAGVVAKQAYDGIKELVTDHAPDVEILADAFEINSIPPAPAAEQLAALRSAMAGRMGSPTGFQLGNRAASNNGYVVG